MTDKEFLNWIITRLTNLFGDDPNADFIHRLRNIANKSEELSLRIKLEDLFDETKVDTWLHKPNKAFDNKRPIDLIHEGNTGPIYKMIYIWESGEPLL